MSRKDRFGLVGNTIASTFRVDEVVAEGGFGVVYRAFHLHFRAPVALKCLKIPVELSDDERSSFLEQFRSEAEIMFRLSGSLPNIVRPLHVDAVHTPSGEFVPVMALEWLEGQSFEKIIEERAFAGRPPLGLEELVELLTPAAFALDQAHDFKASGGKPGEPAETLAIIHRDVKPDNLFLCTVGGEQTVKILDFGISKIRRSAEQLAGHFSQTSGQAPFSPAYGAPEQWVPKRYGQTGAWTDVWGLALTLVEIIKGDAVISGDHQAMMGTALDDKVRPTPRNEGVEVADEVEAVFGKALAVDPRYRYQSVRSFWNALREAMKVGGASSQSRIRIENSSFSGLPPMSAPTPWAPPASSSRGVDVEKPVPGLPAMLVPAPLEATLAEDLMVAPFYPNDPRSGLSPVLPAPGAHANHDLLIPPLDFEHDGSSSPGELRRRTAARRTTSPRPAEAAARPRPGAFETEIELEPTSIFPDAPNDFGPDDDIPPLDDHGPLPLVPSSERHGTSRRQRR